MQLPAIICGTKQIGWVHECRFFVRQDSAYYSGTDYYHPYSWTCASNYTQSGDSRYDWCAVTLWDNLGSSNGWFGKSWSSGSIDSLSVTLSGYPLNWGRQYTGSGVTSNSTYYTVRYNIDTLPGNSGSPVYTPDYKVKAIHTGSYDSFTNRGNRITEWLYGILQEKYEAGYEIYG